jgi:hypothetical protein
MTLGLRSHAADKNTAPGWECEMALSHWLLGKDHQPQIQLGSYFVFVYIRDW